MDETRRGQTSVWILLTPRPAPSTSAPSVADNVGIHPSNDRCCRGAQTIPSGSVAAHSTGAPSPSRMAAGLCSRVFQAG